MWIKFTAIIGNLKFEKFEYLIYQDKRGQLKAITELRMW